MSAAGVVTILLASVAVAALAVYLIRVALLLKRVNTTLGSVIEGVQAIEVATRPVNSLLGSIASELGSTQKSLEDLLAAKSGPRTVTRPVTVSRLRSRGN
jgi:hypothetical protein